MSLMGSIMLAEAPLIPEAASTLAERWEPLFWFIFVITGAATVLVAVLLTYFCFKYRKRAEGEETPRILGSHRLELFWTLTPLVIFLFMFGWGVSVYNYALRVPPDAPEIYIVGKRWMWKVQYPTGQREINEIHLLVGQPVKVTITSEDVIHSVGIPAFRIKTDAVPGRYVSTWYHPTKTGTFHLFCDQYCGEGHSRMVGKVHVLDREQYEQWLLGKTAGDGPLDGSLAWEGRKHFLRLQCSGCHNVGPEQRAPVLEGLYRQRVPLRGGGSVVADEGYIRESILNPNAKVVEGWNYPSIMPTYKGRLAHGELSEEEVLIRLIAFIKTLGPGQTPVRTEEFPPPVGAPAPTLEQPEKGPAPGGAEKKSKD